MGQAGAGRSVSVASTPQLVRLVEGQHLEVADAAVGTRHTILLDRNGFVWSFGDDSKLQLLLGDTRSNLGDARAFEGRLPQDSQFEGMDQNKAKRRQLSRMLKQDSASALAGPSRIAVASAA